MVTLNNNYNEAAMTNQEILTWAQSQDVEGLREFLLSEPHLPLITLGSGGASSVGEYASLLYGATLGLSRAYTPLSAFSIKTVRKSEIII